MEASMKSKEIIITVGLFLAGSGAASAQPAPPQPRPATQVIRDLIAGSEKQLMGVAEAMPEDNYEFAPTNGAFRGVRNFARQVKHAAAVNYLVAASLLGEPITADVADERGPDSVKSKADVVKYLKDSYTYLHKAASTIDEKNAFAPFKGPFPRIDTRIGLIIVAVSHSSNHYGQMVEYLRMSGILPPQSP
jgi:uncharacterized damage-inducible protein DinB